MQTPTTTSPYMNALIATATENGGRVTVTEKEASALVATGRFVRISGSERARGGFLVTSCTVVTVALV